MFPFRGIGTMPFPSACALPCAQATAGSEATVAPETAVLSKSRRVKLFIADRVYSRTIILQTFSGGLLHKACPTRCLTFCGVLRLCTQSRCVYELESHSVRPRPERDCYLGSFG